MAVSINSVYKKVLTIANKEQRGYMTPVQFNLLANQVQQSIFEQYFYDLKQASRVKGNDTNNADHIEILKEKISIFESVNKGDFNIKPVDFYKITDIIYRDGTVVQHLTRREYNVVNKNSLTKPSLSNPVYTLQEDYVIDTDFSSAMPGNYSPWIIIDNGTTLGQNTTYQDINAEYTLYYIRRPKAVKWGYTLVGQSNFTDTPIYNSQNSIDFELHDSEEYVIVNKILKLFGIMIKDPSLYQLSNAEDVTSSQNEKQ